MPKTRGVDAVPYCGASFCLLKTEGHINTTYRLCPHYECLCGWRSVSRWQTLVRLCIPCCFANPSSLQILVSSRTRSGTSSACTMIFGSSRSPSPGCKEVKNVSHVFAPSGNPSLPQQIKLPARMFTNGLRRSYRCYGRRAEARSSIKPVIVAQLVHLHSLLLDRRIRHRLCHNHRLWFPVFRLRKVVEDCR